MDIYDKQSYGKEQSEARGENSCIGYNFYCSNIYNQHLKSKDKL